MPSESLHFSPPFKRALHLALFGWFACGCMGNPSPLTPSLSGSIGVPHNGTLTEGVELPKAGPGFRRYRPHSDTHYALPRLVAAIQRAASALEISHPGGFPLVVGDLSLPTGGKIPRHNSHRTGRDVDFLYFLVSPSGFPIPATGFQALEADGFVRFADGRYARLDIPRQWAFFRHLLQDPEIDVQFLFISRALEAHIIRHALAVETQEELIWRAQTVMLEPVDSLPHADHVHMRIACRPKETVTGCSGGGPHFPWFPELSVLESSDEWLALALTSDPLPALIPHDPQPADALPARSAAALSLP